MLQTFHTKDTDRAITIFNAVGILINVAVKNVTTQLHCVLWIRPGTKKSFPTFWHHGTGTHRRSIYRIPWCKQRILYIQRWPGCGFSNLLHIWTSKVLKESKLCAFLAHTVVPNTGWCRRPQENQSLSPWVVMEGGFKCPWSSSWCLAF